MESRPESDSGVELRIGLGAELATSVEFVVGINSEGHAESVAEAS